MRVAGVITAVSGPVGALSMVGASAWVRLLSVGVILLIVVAIVGPAWITARTSLYEAETKRLIAMPKSAERAVGQSPEKVVEKPCGLLSPSDEPDTHPTRPQLSRKRKKRRMRSRDRKNPSP